MICPHDPHAGGYGTFRGSSLTFMNSNSSNCPQCELLLRVLQLYDPQWIAENMASDTGWVRIIRDNRIELIVGKPYEEPPLYDSKIVDAFHLLRYSPGMLSLKL
jgi:hypothetical protein